eukprot:3666730-Pyramimonas_sp.AAC.1
MARGVLDVTAGPRRAIAPRQTIPSSGRRASRRQPPVHMVNCSLRRVPFPMQMVRGAMGERLLARAACLGPRPPPPPSFPSSENKRNFMLMVVARSPRLESS